MPAIAPPPSAPAAPPSQPAEPPMDSSLYGAGAEIDELDGKAPEAPVLPPGRKPPEDEPEDEIEEKAPEKRSYKQETEKEIDDLDVVENPEADKAKQAAKAAAEKDASKENGEKLPVRAKDLKIVYEQVKSEKKALESELATTKAELEKVRVANPDQVKALAEELKAVKTRRDELESEIRHLNYAKSEEYQTQYEAPYKKAWENAASDLRELTVEQEDGSSRQATMDDLIRLSNMPLGEARKAAVTMFGPAADDVMAHRRQVIDLSRKQSEALETSKKTASERAKVQEVEMKERQQKLSGIWTQEKEAFSNQFPKWYKPVEGDTEGNTLLEKGYAEVDKFFNDAQTPPEERVKMHVRLRGKAANHDRMALRLKRASEKIKKLKDDLAAYQQAEPPAGKAGKTKAAKINGSVFETADSEIEALNEPD